MKDIELPIAKAISKTRSSQLYQIYKRESNIFILLILTTFIYLISFFIQKYGARFLGDYYIQVTIIAYIIFSGLSLYILYDVYKRDPKFVLILISVLIFLYAIILYQIFNESAILTSGVTLILVIITGWYAAIMKTQSEIMQVQMEASINEKRGKYIAEIARSIFSPMQSEIISFCHVLDDENYVTSVSPLKTVNDDIRLPEKFFSGSILIKPYTEYLKRKPAEKLLDIPDDKFQRDYLPKIKFLSQNINKTYEDFNQSLISIYQNKSLIWTNFKEYCKELDPNPIFQEEQNLLIFFESSLDDKKQFFNHFIYKIPISDERIIEFSNTNKEKIRNWLLKSQLKTDIENYLKSKLLLKNLLKELDLVIDDLLLDWKIRYFLVEAELS